MALTVKAVEAAKGKEKAYKLTDGGGLYLYVAPTGLRSWRANHSKDGKQATRTYGRYPEVSLADARRLHVNARDEAAAPAAKKVPTFEEVASAWLKIKLPALNNGKHQIQVENTLERWAYPRLGKLPVDQIPRAKMVEVVQAVQAGGQIETAHRVAGRICSVLDHAVDIGVIEHHGAAKLSRVLLSRKVRKPMASVPPDEAGALLRAIDDYDETITRLGLRMLAMTFTRVDSLRGMRWDELREDGAVWVVPAERMKLKLPHVVPLPRQAQELLKEIHPITGHQELVFESPLRARKPVSENTFLFALYRLGYRGRMTAHGFRALASTVLNEESGYSADVIERQLAHQETDAVRAAYNRAEYLPQRRALMQWWADWLEAARSNSPGPARANA